MVHASGVTIARGQGRETTVCAALSAMKPTTLAMSFITFSAYPEHRRDILEPCDQRRRQIDPGGQNKRQMCIHRHVGRFGGRRRAEGLPEGQSVKPQQQRTERDEKSEDKRHRKERLACKGRAYDQEFAHERRQAAAVR